MKQNIIKILVCAFFISGCATSWKTRLSSTGDLNTAIENVIIDFAHTSKLFEKDSVFVIFEGYYQPGYSYDEIFSIDISGAVNKKFPRIVDTIGSINDHMPTHYVIHEGKLFYWTDPNAPFTKEVASVLLQYDCIDSTLIVDDITFHGGIAPLIIDDGKEGVTYFVCKKDYLNYKKKTYVHIKKLSWIRRLFRRVFYPI